MHSSATLCDSLRWSVCTVLHCFAARLACRVCPAFEFIESVFKLRPVHCWGVVVGWRNWWHFFEVRVRDDCFVCVDMTKTGVGKNLLEAEAIGNQAEALSGAKIVVTDPFTMDDAARDSRVNGSKGEYFHSLKIDGRVFKVNYVSHDNFTKLWNEYCKEARTCLTHGSKNRAWLRCVHCGREGFSNKYRLNFHRWMEGCPSYLDRNGNPKRLLPYPDQGTGQGKTTELVRKGKESQVHARTASGYGEGSGRRTVRTAVTVEEVVEREGDSEDDQEDSKLDFSAYERAPKIPLRQTPKCKSSVENPVGVQDQPLPSKRKRRAVKDVVPLERVQMNESVHKSGPKRKKRSHPRSEFNMRGEQADANEDRAARTSAPLSYMETQVDVANVKDAQSPVHVEDEYGTVDVLAAHPGVENHLHAVNDSVVQPLSVTTRMKTFAPVASSSDKTPLLHAIENNTALGLYWRSGDGDLRIITNAARTTDTVEVRLQRLRRMEVDVVIQARQQAVHMRETKVSPAPPDVVAEPDLLKLLKVHPQLLDWVFAGQTRHEFLASWEAYKRSGEAAKAGERMLCWYFLRCKEKMYPEDYAAITRAQQAWTAAQAYDREPKEIVGLANFLQYTLDLADWRIRADEWKSTTNDECENLVKEASVAWKNAHASDIEAAVWDWCPFWAVLQHLNFIENLPKLPWTHDSEEAVVVRESLTRIRFEHLSPPPSVLILRLAMHLEYGKWRQFSCPRFGVTDDLVRALCRKRTVVYAAASTFAAEGTFLYTGIVEEDVLQIRDNFLRDVDMLNHGRGDDLLLSVKHWVHIVQFRALQDLAVQSPTLFDACWTTIFQSEWMEKSMHWQQMLRFRESLDIGWVAEKETPQWANRTRQSRMTMQCNVRALLRAIQEDDDDHWNACIQKRQEVGPSECHETGGPDPSDV